MDRSMATDDRFLCGRPLEGRLRIWHRRSRHVAGSAHCVFRTTGDVDKIDCCDQVLVGMEGRDRRQRCSD
jgi:hypothetical protein